MRTRRMLCGLAGLIVAGSLAAAEAQSEPRLIRQVWASTGVKYEETGSLAAARLADGSVRLFATARGDHRVDMFDAETGQWISSFGKKGKAVGEFKHPYGIAVAYLPVDQQPGALLLVAERDNRRVQAFWADGMQSAGTFGEGELKRPCGLAVMPDGAGVLAFVTDDDADENQRVRVYRLSRDGDALRATSERAFGETDGPGLLRSVESIVVDGPARRVLICDKHGKQRNVKVYDLDGRFTGTVFGSGLVQGDPEGLAVCPTVSGGVVVLTDRRSKATRWHVFDRQTYEWREMLESNPPISKTDGICIFEQPYGSFPSGAFFAVHDDKDIRAYSLGDVLQGAAFAPQPAEPPPTPPAATSPPPPVAAPQSETPAAVTPSVRPDRSVVLRKIAFGSCIRQDKEQPIWEAVLAEKPELFVLLGDNIYGDTEDMTILRDKYAKLAANPGFAKLRASCPLLATWDDHDFGKNDAGAEYPRKKESQQVMLDFFGEPSDSPRRKGEGVYDSQVFGVDGRRVQVILLDTRYFRSALSKGPEGRPGDGRLGPYVASEDPNATILGEEQWKWLAAQLSAPAELRIIASSIQVAAEDHRFEKWMNIPHERERLFQLIRDTRAAGVLFLSGDRHIAELSVMDADIGYDLYDATSSALNQTSKWYNEINRHRWGGSYWGPNFGLISIDWEAADPLITLEIRQEDGKPAIWHQLALSDLQPQK